MVSIKRLNENVTIDAIIYVAGDDVQECGDRFAGLINADVAKSVAEAKKGSCTTVFSQGRMVSLVPVKLCSADDVRTVGDKYVKALGQCMENELSNVCILLKGVEMIESSREMLTKICEKAVSSGYRFARYKSEAEKQAKVTIYIDTASTYLDDAMHEGQIIAEASMLTRDLVNTPACDMTPALLAEAAKKAGAESGFAVTVYDAAQIKEMGMEALLAVGRGSVNEPVLIVMSYNGDADLDEKTGLIGKGLCYDTGGYSIKSNMYPMHVDMAGAASVVGAMKAIAELKLKKNVVGIIGACENKINGAAYLPGDIIKSMNGKYIQITNTDAEGRVTLADVVTYAVRKEAVTRIIDIATLTGAAKVALGGNIAAFMSNDDSMSECLKIASEASGERSWRLPIDEELMPEIKSDVADIKNSSLGSSVGGGCILGGMFIREFVEDRPWIHIDMGFTCWSDKKLPDGNTGATGFGPNLLCSLVKRI